MALFGKGPHVGASGKHYFNPHVMQAHEGGGGEEPKGHPKAIHGHFHEDGTAHTHIHHADDTHEHMDHGSHEEAHDHMNSMMESPNEENLEEEISPDIHEKVRKAESGAY